MNTLRSLLKRRTPEESAPPEEAPVVDSRLAGARTQRQLRILEWHIGNCPQCSEYLREYNTYLEVVDARSLPDGATLEHAHPLKEVNSADFDTFMASPLFRGLADNDLEHIFTHGEIMELDEGASAIEEGKVNSGLFVVLEGELKVALPAGPDRYGEVELTRRRPPDCFGEYAFVDYKLASASVTATRPSRLFKVEFDELDTLMEADAELGKAIYENVLLLVVARLRDDDAELDLFKSD